jgi:hypothetical protein
MISLVWTKHTISASPPIQQGISIISKQRQCFSMTNLLIVLEPSVDLFETCEITLTPGIIDTQAPA